jgi:hypothetical protein
MKKFTGPVSLSQKGARILSRRKLNLKRRRNEFTRQTRKVVSERHIADGECMDWVCAKNVG